MAINKDNKNKPIFKNNINPIRTILPHTNHIYTILDTIVLFNEHINFIEKYPQNNSNLCLFLLTRNEEERIHSFSVENKMLPTAKIK